jgi:ABC-2 type transport system permease protein
MNFKIIWAIFRKDILDAKKNYQVILIVLTPILLSVLFTNLYKESKTKTLLPKIGIIGRNDHPLLKDLTTEKFGVKLFFYQTRAELEAKIIEGEIGFGVLLPEIFPDNLSGEKLPALTLIYPAGLPPYVVERMENTLEKQIREFLKKPAPPLPIAIEMSPVGGNKLGDQAFSNDFFPMLIIMAMGMVGFLAMPLSFVEEKEKRTILAIFLTPANSGELIWGKSLFGFSLIIFTVFTMIAVNHRWGEGNHFYFWLLVVLGAFLCLFIGLLIAIFAETQASVNAFGTTIFMVFQLVPNLSQSSDLMKSLAPWVPSTYIGRGLKKALFLDLTKVDVNIDVAAVFCVVLVAYLAVFICLRYRRQMI